MTNQITPTQVSNDADDKLAATIMRNVFEHAIWCESDIAQAIMEYRLAAIEECATAARDALLAGEWPPEDGDKQIDEVLAAIRNRGTSA